jgi:hypothetical protein
MSYQAVKDPEAASAMLLAYRGMQKVPVEAGLRKWEESCPDEIREELEQIRQVIDSEYDEMG